MDLGLISSKECSAKSGHENQKLVVFQGDEQVVNGMDVIPSVSIRRWNRAGGHIEGEQLSF
jgi:hypothetical protein